MQLHSNIVINFESFVPINVLNKVDFKSLVCCFIEFGQLLSSWPWAWHHHQCQFSARIPITVVNS